MVDSRTCLACLSDYGQILSLGDAIREQPLPHRDCACASLNTESAYRLRARCNCHYESAFAPVTAEEVERDEYRRMVRAQIMLDRAPPRTPPCLTGIVDGFRYEAKWSAPATDGNLHLPHAEWHISIGARLAFSWSGRNPGGLSDELRHDLECQIRSQLPDVWLGIRLRNGRMWTVWWEPREQEWIGQPATHPHPSATHLDAVRLGGEPSPDHHDGEIRSMLARYIEALRPYTARADAQVFPLPQQSSVADVGRPEVPHYPQRWRRETLVNAFRH